MRQVDDEEIEKYKLQRHVYMINFTELYRPKYHVVEDWQHLNP